jgi:Tfp pilus assembly protein PilV
MILLSSHPSARRRACAALSLIEVMIAMTIFFMCVFAILGMVSNTLRNARALQNAQVDAPGALASFLSTSNRLDEGSYSGDFGDLYPDYDYVYEVTVITNNLVRVDMVVAGGKGKTPEETHMSLFLTPPSQQGTAPGAGFRR